MHASPYDIPASSCIGPSRGVKRGARHQREGLRGKRFRRLFPRVWVHVDHVMTDLDWIVAASLAMPTRAQLSHLTRIQALGLDFGDTKPLHFTVDGRPSPRPRRHLSSPHRGVAATRRRRGDAGAAFIQYCADARMIDAIKVGDWLLHHRHMTCSRSPSWRAVIVGAQVPPGPRVLPHLEAASRSLKESESRAVLVFSGLPKPEVNKDVRNASRVSSSDAATSSICCGSCSSSTRVAST